MRNKSRSSKRERGSVIILVTMLLGTVIIPLVALAIDMTIYYLVQAKLSASVDGAALGAGRLIGTPADLEEVAERFLKANYRPENFMGSKNLEIEAEYSQPTLTTHKITVSASVDTPRVFGHMFAAGGFQAIAATAIATRRDSRVVMVLDRSLSMESKIGVLKDLATKFTKSFVPSTDQLGLVVYGTGAMVAYPVYPRPYNFDPNSAGGPDPQFWDYGATACTKEHMVCSISRIAASGFTNIGEGLYLAYLELQKARNRDLAAYGDDDRINVIVLFTDGIPNMIPVYLNGKDAAHPEFHSLKTPSTQACTYDPYRTTSWATPAAMPDYVPASSTNPVDSTAMIGVLGAHGYYPNWSASGFSQRPQVDTTTGHDLKWWLQTREPSATNPIINWSKALAGCVNLKKDNMGKSTMLQDLRRIPPVDLYGHSLDAANPTDAYKYSVAYTGTAHNRNVIPTSYSGGYQLALTAWILVDNVGEQIRSNEEMRTMIYTIGYEGSGGLTDEELLKRVANAAGAKPDVRDDQQVGRFYLAEDDEQLDSAFTEIASEVLRLAK